MASVLSGSVVAGAGCHLGTDCPFPAPDVDIFQFSPIWQFTAFGHEVALTKPMLMVVMFSAVIIIVFALAFGRARLVPNKFQSLGELGYLFVRDQISRETIGKHGDHFVPFLFTLFFFIFVMNMLGIMPGAQIPATAFFALPVALALTVWVTYMYLGIKHQGPWGFFRNMMFPPGVPPWVLFILAPIELLSNVFVRPFTLAIRLFANMFAGHILLVMFSVTAFYMLSLSVVGILGATTSFLLTIIMTAFELLIEFLQAYIFTLLTASYIAGSLHAEH